MTSAAASAAAVAAIAAVVVAATALDDEPPLPPELLPLDSDDASCPLATHPVQPADAALPVFTVATPPVAFAVVSNAAAAAAASDDDDPSITKLYFTPLDDARRDVVVTVMLVSAVTLSLRMRDGATPAAFAASAFSAPMMRSSVAAFAITAAYDSRTLNDRPTPFADAVHGVSIAAHRSLVFAHAASAFSGCIDRSSAGAAYVAVNE